MDDGNRFSGNAETRWRGTKEQLSQFLLSVLGNGKFVPSFPELLQSSSQPSGYETIVVEEVELIARTLSSMLSSTETRATLTVAIGSNQSPKEVLDEMSFPSDITLYCFSSNKLSCPEKFAVVNVLILHVFLL